MSVHSDLNIGQGHSQAVDKGRHKQLIALYSVLVGIILTTMKFVVGILTGSLGILSEALHSFFDLCAALITLFSVRISVRAPDSTHQYGHGKMENISALLESLLLLVTCVWVVYEAIQRLTGKMVHVEATFWSFFVMAFSLVLDVFISRLLYYGARKYNSQALEADGLHYSSDILSSAVVIAGLIGVRLGVPSLDPVAALGVAFLVSVASLRLSNRSVHELLDGAPKGLADLINETVLKVPGVEKIDSLRVRSSGSSKFIDMVVFASRLLSLDQSNQLADRIEAEVKKTVPESDLMVHFHPVANKETIQDTARAISQRFTLIQEVHNISAYHDGKSGRYFLSLHVKIAPSMSLEEAHRLMDELEETLKKEIPQLGGVETHIEIIDGIYNGDKSEIGKEELETLRAQVLEDPCVLGIHDVTLHKLPNGTMISCHIDISKELSLEAAHAVATQVEEKIKAVLPGAKEVLVHTEPRP